MSSIYDYISSTKFNGIFTALENIPFMDSKNITNLIVSEYANNDSICSMPFLTTYLYIIQKLFDSQLYLNKSLTTVYLVDYPYLDDVLEGFVDLLNEFDSKHKFNLIEQYLIIQLHLFIEYIIELVEDNDNSNNKSKNNKKMIDMWFTFYASFLNKYINSIALFKCNKLNIATWRDFLKIKIKQPILLINPVFLNKDSRSVRSNDHVYNKNKNKTVIFEYNLDFPIYPNFDIYCPNGFTILEYLIHILTIRGNPLDRWYTLFCDCVDRSYYKTPNMFGYKGVIELEKKYATLIEEKKVDPNVKTIYISFDHGS
jgi:hypothetical protein